MDDNIDQLLKNLRLRRIREVLERELKEAVKQGRSYEELLAPSGLLIPKPYFSTNTSIYPKYRP